MGRILKGAKLIDGKWVVSASLDPLPESLPLEPSGLPVVSEADLEAQLASARAEADDIVAAAHVEADALREAARLQGYQEGLARGESEGQGLWQARVQALSEEARTLVSARKAWFQAAETDVLRLALLCAERILHREARDREALVSLIRDSLVELGDAAIVRIRVHPADAPGLSAHLGLRGIELKADPALGLGGAIFETETGRIDARYATQFREMASAILLSDPAEDPALAPAIAELGAPCETSSPVAEPAWKLV